MKRRRAVLQHGQVLCCSRLTTCDQSLPRCLWQCGRANPLFVSVRFRHWPPCGVRSPCRRPMAEWHRLYRTRHVSRSSATPSAGSGATGCASWPGPCGPLTAQPRRLRSLENLHPAKAPWSRPRALGPSSRRSAPSMGLCRTPQAAAAAAAAAGAVMWRGRQVGEERALATLVSCRHCQPSIRARSQPYTYSYC